MHKVALALAPVDKKVFDEELRGHHAQSVMHPAAGVELAHTRIDKGKACLTSLPAFEPLLVVVPFKVLGFTTKRFAAAQPGIGSENMVVELAK